MEWLLYALLSALLITAVNFGDKFVVETQVRDPQALMIVLPIAGVIAALIMWALAGFGVLAPQDALPMMLSGATLACGVYFYFQAMRKTETTRIILLLQVQPLQVLILSMIFLGERLTTPQYLGFALILSAVIAAAAYGNGSQNKAVTQEKRDYHVPLLLMIATISWSSGVVAAGSAIDRVVVDIPSLLISIVYTNLGFCLTGLTLYLLVPSIRRAFHDFVPQFNRTTLISLVLLEISFMLRQMAFYQALTLGPVTLVTIVSSLNIFFGIFAGWMLTRWKPGIFREVTTRRVLGTKFLLATLAFAGLLMLG